MKVIKDPYLKINENILSYNKSFVQLSNISQAKVCKEEKKSYSGLAILGVIVGIPFSMDANFPWIGIAILIFSLILLLPVFIINLQKKYILILTTNSGSVIAFRCKDEDFLVEVLELVKKRVNDNANYEINLDKCTITNSQIGKNNMMQNS